MKESGMIFIFALFLFVFPLSLKGEPSNVSGVEENQSNSETLTRKSHRNKGTQLSEEATVSPTGRKSQIPFSRSLPEDISNENFPDVIESFDYPNVPLMDLIQAIGKLTGLNFIIDPGVTNKKITILAPSRITVAEAYKAFLSALAANGYTVVKSGAFWKIMETKNALKDNPEIYSGGYFPNTDQLITRVIKLKHINAKEFSTSIKHLASAGNQISFHASSNTIIISDYGSVVERIMKLIRVMDVPGSEESVKIIPIIHAAATDLAQILTELLSEKTSRTRPTGRRNVPRIATRPLTNQSSGNIKVSHIIPDERTNSLIVSANKNGIERVEELVQKLDTYVDPSRTGGIYVYNVLYGTAEQVYNTLMGIAPSKVQDGGSGASRPRSRTSPRSGRTGSKSFPSSTSPLFQNVTIMADTNTNSLIISARNKYDFERVKAVLKKIDVPKDQVFVQAIIVEMFVGQGDAWETNLITALTGAVKEWALKLLNINDPTATPIVGFLNKQLSPNLESIKELSFGPGFSLGLPLSFLLQGSNIGSDLDNVDVKQYSKQYHGEDYEALDYNSDKAKGIRNQFRQYKQSQGDHLLKQAFNFPTPLLQILKEMGDVNVLSTPQITALDNVKATIEVGENAPIGLTNTSSGGFTTNNAVDRADVTLKMELTPRINPDSGIIQMDILQQFDDFSTTKSPASELRSRAVHITKRNIETKLVLHDGETAVLGGLMIDKEVRSENKVPFLGDIPILGWLFKGSTVEKQKRNLIVFLTPTIIRGKNQKAQTRRLLGKKLEERIDFIKRNMKGVDPHGRLLKKLTATKESSPVKTEGPKEVILPKSPIQESTRPQEMELTEEESHIIPEEPQLIQPEPSQELDTLPSDQISIQKSPEEQEMELIEELREDPILIPEERQPIQETDNLPGQAPKQKSPEEQELIEESEEESEELSPDSEKPTQEIESLLDQALRQDLPESEEKRTIQGSEEEPPQLLEELNLIEIFPQTPNKNQPSNKPEKSSAKKKESSKETSVPMNPKEKRRRDLSGKNAKPIPIETMGLFPGRLC